jgi:hypothetical protein
MRHNREEVIQRMMEEFEALDSLVSGLSEAEWETPLQRPETKDPWTVKDSLAHITHWKADTARSIRGERRPAEERGLSTKDGNHLVYMRWLDRSPKEVLKWHREVQEQALKTLKEKPDEYFSGKERGEDWPGDLVGHSSSHRVRDIQQALEKRRKQRRK